MKIITRAVFQMTPEGFTLLEQDSFDYIGDIAHAKGGGTAPAPPDPAVQTNAEAAANRYNTVGPGGSTTWNQGDVQIIGYDGKGNPQYGNQWTQETHLDPNEQHQYDARNQIASQLLDSAGKRIPEFADNAFTFDSATPEVAKAQYSKNMALLQPEFAKATNTFEQRMANAGLPVGSEAYNDAMHQHEADQNEAMRSAAADAVTQGNQLSQTERQQNYNELAAALGSSQVQTPSAGAFTPVDVAGAYQQQYQGQLANYNAGQAQQAGDRQAAAGLVGAGVMVF
jgi:hypothetical protein